MVGFNDTIFLGSIYSRINHEGLFSLVDEMHVPHFRADYYMY